ncbi:hypothetical protein [Methylocystis sp. MJC1]|nr:hypothetical protein [Methylocystis sp. MJC1]
MILAADEPRQSLEKPKPCPAISISIPPAAQRAPVFHIAMRLA